MNTLRQFYIKWMTSLLFFSFLAILLKAIFFEKLKDLGWLGISIFFLTYLEVILSLFIVWFERYIRTRLWKQIHSELDFSGKWTGITTYEDIYIGNRSIILPIEVKHDAKIEQDCLSFVLAPSGRSFVSWASKSTELRDKDHLTYAYYVNYKGDDPRFPKEEVLGIEELSVVDRDEKNKKPIRMNGRFWHCARGQEPVYGGSVVFTRDYDI